MGAATSDQCTDGPAWVVGSRDRSQGPQTLYVWAPEQQLASLKRQLRVDLRLGLMDIAELHRAMTAWTARFGATDRQRPDWEEFAGGARVPIAILIEPSARDPVPVLLRGVDSIGALAAEVPAGRPIPVLFARAAQKPEAAAAQKPEAAAAHSRAPDVPLGA